MNNPPDFTINDINVIDAPDAIQIRDENNQIRNNFLIFLKKKNFDKVIYDEVWCSNELLAKMFINESNKKVIYFFHKTPSFLQELLPLF